MFESLKNLFIKKEKRAAKSASQRVQELYESVRSEELCIQIGSDLECFSDLLCSKIWNLREDLFEKTGFIMPVVKIKVNDFLQENEYNIFVRNHISEIGFAVPNEDFAPDEIIKSLENTCIEHIDEVFSSNVAEKYLDIIKSDSSHLISDLLYVTDISGLRIILVDLLKDGQSIKNISLIFEKICEYSHNGSAIKPNPKLIAEFIKQNMPVN